MEVKTAYYCAEDGKIRDMHTIDEARGKLKTVPWVMQVVVVPKLQYEKVKAALYERLESRAEQINRELDLWYASFLKREVGRMEQELEEMRVRKAESDEYMGKCNGRRNAGGDEPAEAESQKEPPEADPQAEEAGEGSGNERKHK